MIINVSSVHQLIPKPDYLGYSVSKGGMQNLTRTLALEYAARGIRVNGIGPGATVTPINRAWIDDPVKREQVESHIPMRRAGTAEEMGAVACFLASDDARVHHRSDDLRRRRADAVPELPRSVVLGMTVDCRTRALGKLALIDDAKRAGALALVKTGPDVRPGARARRARARVPGPLLQADAGDHRAPRQPGGGVGENEVNWITELVSGTMQLGTHLDALSHLQMGDRGYGGFTVANSPARPA